jgi:hypothetical protein
MEGPGKSTQPEVIYPTIGQHTRSNHKAHEAPSADEMMMLKRDLATLQMHKDFQAEGEKERMI